MATTSEPTAPAGFPPAAHDEDLNKLSADEIQLRSQGHIGELPRQFSSLSIIGLAFAITNSWVGYAGMTPYREQS